MKIRKTVSDSVIAANRKNSEKSTGPRSAAGKMNASLNATTHGLLAKRLSFLDEGEHAEFMSLMDEVHDGLESPSVFERILAEEAAICCWKLRYVHEWELQEMREDRKAARALLLALARSCDQFPIPVAKSDWRPDASLGLECQDVVIRSGSASSKQEADLGDEEKTGQSRHLQVVAQLGTPLDRILRYETAIKRDLYRAIATLRDIRREELAEQDAR